MARQSGRYLGSNEPSRSSGLPRIEDVLKQRRCGPFWCLPIVHRSGLLKRHTFIAGSADGSPIQAKADKANHGRAMPRFITARCASFGPGISTARVGVRASRLCPPADLRPPRPSVRSLIVRVSARSETPMATQRILDFLATRRPNGPCLVVDLDVVRNNFHAFQKALPDSRIFYAVKANPAPETLRLLAQLGSSFDTASVAEIEMALDAGATAERISFGNTIKKERDILRAFELGIRLYAVD